MKVRRRQPITLMEIMIVIFIIGIIASVLAYNMRGSLEEGRAYKSEHGSRQVHDFLSLAMAQGKTKTAVQDKTKDVLDSFGFVNNAEKLLKDGWNKSYKVHVTADGNIVVFSEKWMNYLIQKKHYTAEQLEEEYPWAFYFKEEHTDGTNSSEEPEQKEESSTHSD